MTFKLPLPPAKAFPAAKECHSSIPLWSFIPHSFLLLLFFLVTGFTNAATVRAYLQPDHAHTGEVVSYVITVQNGTVQSVPQLRLPVQVGMTSGLSSSQNIEIRGTQQVFSTQLAWGVAGTEPGEFVIPPQEVLVNGEVLKTNEVRLIVSESPANAAPPGTPEDANMPLFQIEVGKTEVYQGEVVPISARLFVPRSVMLRRVGLIEVEKNDFAIARFPQQADQANERINDIDYIVVTYRSMLSALHAGDLKVGPATCELLFEVYDENAQRQMRRGLPFGMIMGGTETRKQVVKSQEVKVKVLPLPTEGKPAHFSGAVGDFKITATASPNELAVGDPLAVDITIDGSGNFDALNPPSLMPPDGWKSYPPRRYNVDGPVDPNLTPTAHRSIGYSMVFVPEKVHAELPPFELSFFSPSEKKYVTARTTPIPLHIKPGTVIAAASGAEGSGGTEAPKPPAVQQPKPQISDILMNVPEKASWLNTATVSPPLTTSARFWAIQSIPAALVILAALFSWFRRYREETTGGLRGELQQLWHGLEESGLDDRGFLQRAAHFIHRSQPGAVQDDDLKEIIHRYETQSFTAAPTPDQVLGSGERSRILSTLAPLLKRAVLFVTAFATLSLSAADESPDEVYRQAREALEKGKFTTAQYLGESLTKQQPPALSSAVFSLIANARYRQEDFGRAALWYQRAQLLEPLNPEVRQNLRHLDEKLRFFRFAEDSPLIEWSLLLNKNTWVIAASAGVWLILLALLRCILTSGRKSPGGACALMLTIIGLVVFIPSATFAAVRPPPGDRVKDIMVVTTRGVSAFTAATLTSGSVIDIPAGSQIRLLEKRGAWSYVEIPSGTDPVRGWIESTTYTPLWPWNVMLVP
ncbi:BatD family protein [Prosthecobacter sp.]|uniref:BatD family protein n=1 Tax=Prosthecobacter sp. TaxID=1965333 RepID=UPI001DC561A3|nr:BatD family protein [Prosthecobacter sp.]MCB1279536.1 BatD family protein [Prosthecobacter sp.]